MSNTNTTKRTFCTLAFLLLFAQAAAAQSILNFPRAVNDATQDTGIAINNPTAYYADVQLILYGLDGNPIANGLINPVNYRIAPKSELQMRVRELFVADRLEGWIQATSTSSGLVGFYFTGDYNSTLEGSESVAPLATQAMPLIREDQKTHTDLMIINPTANATNVTVAIYNIRGDQIGTVTQPIASHAAFKFRPGAAFPILGSAGASARITSTIPVVATAIVDATDSLMFINGQSIDQSATTRVVPHFLSGNGSNSQLVLSNPNPFPVDTTVTLFSEAGGAVHPSQPGPSSRNITISSHGVVSLDAAAIADLPLTPLVNGWVQIDSGNVPLNGVVVLDSGTSLTAIPMQRPADRMMFAQLTDSRDLFSELDLVNTTTTAAAVDVLILRADGTIVIQKRVTLGARSKMSSEIKKLIPETVGQTDGFIYIRSSAGIYGVEMLGDRNFRFMAAVVPQRTNFDFAPRNVSEMPRITSVEPANDVVPGTTLRIIASTISNDAQVLLGNLTLIPRFTSPFGSVMLVDVPAIEPGYARLRVRSRGYESTPVTLHIASLDDQALFPVKGLAFYQKIEVTDAGLDLNHPAMVPIRNARVEVLDSASQTLLSVSETGDRGQFMADVPGQSPVTIRVLSRLRSTNLQVVNNTNNNSLYSVSTEFDYRESVQAMVVDRGRVSGAFNILEMVQRGNDLVRLADPSLTLPAPTMFWSVGNTKALVGTTSFSVSTNTARILGDRNDDSDEFDDSVIIHEYAHLLAARFSRDDSPGGAHGIGESLDPRLAWSEGWANFFSSAVRKDPIYRDSRGPNGSRILRIDIKDRQPVGDQPGYGSEASIHSLLWDMFDGKKDAGDTTQYPFSAIWYALTDLRNDRFVYLPNFLERFLARNPSELDTIRTLAQLRSIDFQSSVRPSVTNPWPRPVTIGSPVVGWVDSLTPRRENLARSSHFFVFTAVTEQLFAIRMDITGLGPAGNPEANDLDLFLMDVNGRLIDQSDRGLNGQSELITRRLPAGTYIIEIRSYYTKAETNGRVFNSGDYRLSVTSQ